MAEIKLIAFTGRAGSGKDTAASVFQSLRPSNITTFAGPIKEAARFIWGFSTDQLYGPSHMRNEPDPRYPRADGTFLTPREALQKLGTEYGRSCYDQIWMDKAMEAIYHLWTKYHLPVLVTDARFDDEALVVREFPGYVVEVTRAAAPRLNGGAGQHASEAGISPHLVDYRLHNDGNMADLRDALVRMLEHFEAL